MFQHSIPKNSDFSFNFKLLYYYLKFNGEWLLQQLKVSSIELSEFQSLPGQNIKEEKIGLLQSMFHIGQQPFDQVMQKKTHSIFIFLFLHIA